MKLFKKILRSKYIIKIRNLIGIKPVAMNLIHLKNNYSISDGFMWRTDNEFETIFKFSDLMRIFFNEKSSNVEILFYDKNNKFLKKITKSDLKFSNTLIIDEKFMDNIRDYGLFYIYHRINKKINSSIRNACYTGYSYKKNLESYMHGNFPVLFKHFDITAAENKFNEIYSVFMFKTQKYRIQKYFKNFTKSEIFIQNPTVKTIKFSVNKYQYELNGLCGKIIDVTNFNEVEIISNCSFLRPAIFNYKDNYLDVQHG